MLQLPVLNTLFYFVFHNQVHKHCSKIIVLCKKSQKQKYIYLINMASCATSKISGKPVAGRSRAQLRDTLFEVSFKLSLRYLGCPSRKSPHLRRPGHRCWIKNSGQEHLINFSLSVADEWYLSLLNFSVINIVMNITITISWYLSHWFLSKPYSRPSDLYNHCTSKYWRDGVLANENRMEFQRD